jgi:hypothetical protein
MASDFSFQHFSVSAFAFTPSILNRLSRRNHSSSSKKIFIPA